MMISNSLSARGLKPVADYAQQRQHGDRLRYIAGCRCDLCRKANSAYERSRQQARRLGDWNGIVPAGKARTHMLALQALGVGRRTIADVTDIAETILSEIRAGTRKNIRARTERLILAVTADMAADGALLPAAPTWALVKALVRSGFTKLSLARRLGQKGQGLQLGKEFVTVRNAERVKKLHRELMASDEALIPAGPTLRFINELRGEGFTDKQLARHLGFADGELRIGRQRVTRGLAQQVSAMHERLTA